MGLQELRDAFPFPAEAPAVPASDQGWFGPEQEELLEGALGSHTRTVVELGSWLGKSTRFIASRAPNAAVFAVDHWQGSWEHHVMPECKALLPVLYDMFIKSCWAFRDNIVPLRMDTVQGMRLIHRQGIMPDLIFIDAAHDYRNASEDLGAALDLFPGAEICGDDFVWEGVRRAVRERAAAGPSQFYVKGNIWWKEGSAFARIRGGGLV